MNTSSSDIRQNEMRLLASSAASSSQKVSNPKGLSIASHVRSEKAPGSRGTRQDASVIHFKGPLSWSSWIESVKYKNGFLAIFLRRQGREDEPVALLYGGVPSWMVGLILAGKGGRSVGSAYNKLLKGKSEYTFQRVEGREQVGALEEMME